MLVVVPWFLFPTISGGRVRTADVLRGLKGGRFDVTLLMPAPQGVPAGSGEATRAALGDRLAELERVCDRWSLWHDDSARGGLRRVAALASSLPVSVALDRSSAAREAIDAALAESPDVVVIDFVHTAIVCPERFEVPSLCFTHNVESEIYARHAERAAGLKRGVWRSQARKMQDFERTTLARFDTVIAVSDRDAETFQRDLGIERVRTIPTGVDVDFHDLGPEPRDGDLRRESPRLVFTGSMDWLPNIDAVEWFCDEVWPELDKLTTGASLTVVGRDPTPKLVDFVERSGVPCTLTGRVPDVRPFVHEADVSLIPLRIGGGTRLKAFEALALGSPLVSTSLGVEGLPLSPGRDVAIGDTAATFANAIADVLSAGELRSSMRKRGRRLVVEHFSAQAVARVFESHCAELLELET